MSSGGGESIEPQDGPRELARPAFSEDDGSSDPALRTLIDTGAELPIEFLRSRRLLVAVVAVADEVDAFGAEKASHMAVVSMISASGEKGLLAFTCLDSMRMWDPQARPVPVRASDAAAAAIADGAQALVIDVSGPSRLIIRDHRLTALAVVGDRQGCVELGSLASGT